MASINSTESAEIASRDKPLSRRIAKFFFLCLVFACSLAAIFGGCRGFVRYRAYYYDKTTYRKNFWPSIYIAPQVSTPQEKENYNSITDPARLLFIMMRSNIEAEIHICDKRLQEIFKKEACLDWRNFPTVLRDFQEFALMGENEFQMYLSPASSSLRIDERIKYWKEAFPFSIRPEWEKIGPSFPNGGMKKE